MKLFRVLSIAAITIFSFSSLQAQTPQTTVVNSASRGVKGIPFSADTVNEINHVLGDGTRIHQENRGKSFRDSEGRTRNETESVSSVGNAEKFHHVSILDPIENVIINWDSRTKVATIRQWMSPPSPPSPTTVKSRPAPEAVHEKLGTTDIEGFSAVGDKYTRTIEVGKIGNDKPLATVSETWYSTELRLVLRSKIEDPQFGERTIKLVNIQRVEPDPTLFQVPQDYTVHDERTKN